MIWPDLSSTLLPYQNQRRRKIYVSSTFVYCNFSSDVMSSDYKPSVRVCQQTWHFADTVELHVPAVMQFQDYGLSFSGI